MSKNGTMEAENMDRAAWQVRVPAALYTHGSHGGTLRAQGCSKMSSKALLTLAVIAGICASSELHAATISAASVSSTDVSAAILAAKDGDTIALPAGSAVWNSPVTCTRAVTFVGAGTNNTLIFSTMSTGGGDPSAMSLLILYGPQDQVSRVANIQFIGSYGGGDGGCAILAGTGPVRIDHCVISNFNFGVYSTSTGVIDHVTFANNFVNVRSYGSGTGAWNWQNLYPIPFDSLNYLFVEDCSFMFDSRTASSRGYHAIASSGQGSSYVVRHCTIISTADQFGPAFDWHGDNGDGTHGNLSSQVYANNFIISGSSSMDKFVDARGGEGLVYSNTVVGSSTRGIAVREEHPSDFPNDPLPHDLVTNMWVWANYADGQLMDTFVDDSTGILKDGVHYHTVPY